MSLQPLNQNILSGAMSKVIKEFNGTLPRILGEMVEKWSNKDIGKENWGTHDASSN